VGRQVGDGRALPDASHRIHGQQLGTGGARLLVVGNQRVPDALASGEEFEWAGAQVGLGVPANGNRSRRAMPGHPAEVEVGFQALERGKASSQLQPGASLAAHRS
jgi:hypothetical protein